MGAILSGIFALLILIKSISAWQEALGYLAANHQTPFESSIDKVIFGAITPDAHYTQHILYNPEVSQLPISLSHLNEIEIHTTSYDFHQLERFITYAVNYLTQSYLRKAVEVHLYGEPEKLNPNLRNSLTNLCKRVHFYKHTTGPNQK